MKQILKDILLGTVGKLLQIVLIGVGILFVIFGGGGGNIWVAAIGGVLLCVAFGIRYAMGHIVRWR